VPRDAVCGVDADCCGTDWCNASLGNLCKPCRAAGVSCVRDTMCCSGSCGGDGKCD
jgi:hypothetical protein